MAGTLLFFNLVCEGLLVGRAEVGRASGECDKGIVLCTTGIGVSIAANKVDGIRCALLSDVMSARMTREHNDTNMMPKVKKLREMLDKVNPDCHLEVDGGVDLVTVNECKANGANVFVAGSAYFGSADKKAFTVEIEK